jgi:hypothetical protein
LAGFRLGRLGEGDDVRLARVDDVGDGVDRAALAGGVAAFEQDDQPLAGGRDPAAMRTSSASIGSISFS